MTLRLAALAPLALFAAAACSSTNATPASSACGNLPQCPTGQACYQNACVPIANNGTGGHTSVATAGNGNVGAGGNGAVATGGNGTVATAGNSGIPGTGGTGTSTGGASGTTGGSSATGGSGTTGTAGSGPVGTGGPGYWTSKDWHGCSWTGVGTAGVSTANPKDFTAKAAADPYCISGTVGKEANNSSVALLGFNVNEPSTASCVAKAADPNASGPPAVTPTADGIAVNFVKKGTDTSFTFRIQIQTPDGAKPDPVGAANRWCATITDVSGKVFVPWSKFVPSCWETTAAKQGTPYSKTTPISAVVFTIPGNSSADVPYNVCVNGLAYGTTAADAPDGSATQGDLTGTIGGSGTTDADFQRVKVTAGGQNYIIQNNNWGSPDSTNQTLSYKNNSFKITGTTGSGQSAPASFPSIYIGNNGNTANGVFSTKPGDNLPIKVSAITSITSTFRYSPAITSTAINATYDIWFANSIPAGEYKDGIDGFVMIWLRAPKDKHPIGYENGKAGTATVANVSWDIYKGPRGAGPAGNNNAPVVSFVNPADDNSRSQNFTNVDIKKFIDAAKSYGIADTMYLTDVFAGFEIWDGGSSSNLSVDEFTCVVK
ncbi:MAG TPA: hypothetical protein VER96_27720 [Polyangiaceae bacterium]|nr:hypothetical protein [Polyangiaceae bacterium]